MDSTEDNGLNLQSDPLGRAWILCKEGLAPYVAKKIPNDVRNRMYKDDEVDANEILGVMVAPGMWAKYFFKDLGNEPQSWVHNLRHFRPRWAHQHGYTEKEAHDCLSDMLRLLRCVRAVEQAKKVEKMHHQFGEFIYGQQTAPRGEDLQKIKYELKQTLEKANQTIERFNELDALLRGALGKNIKFPLSHPEEISSSLSNQMDDGADPETAYKQTIERLNAVIQLNPDDVEGYLNRAMAYLNPPLGYFDPEWDHDEEVAHYDQAVADFSTVIERQPDNVGAYFHLGLAYLQRDIVAYFEWTLNNYEGSPWVGYLDQAIENFNTAIRRDPDHVEAHFHRAGAYSRKGDYDHAIEDYSTIIERQPENVGAYSGRAGVYSSKGDYDNAIEDYSTVIERRPENVEAYSSRAGVYSSKGDYDNAIEDYSTVIDWQPENAEAFLNRGQVYACQANFNEAIADYNHVLEMIPSGFEDLHQDSIELKKEAIRLRDSIDEHAWPFGSNPDDPDVWHVKALEALDSLDYDEAIKYLERVLRLSPENAEARCNLGLALSCKGEIDGAIKEYKLAIEYNIECAEAWYNLAIARRRQGSLDEAIMNFGTAILMRRDYADAFQNRGISYLRFGDLKQAKSDFAKARELGYRP